MRIRLFVIPLFFPCLFSWTPQIGAAQQLPNAAFENWNGPIVPLEWSTVNDLLPGVITAFQDSNAFEGDFAIGLRTASAGFADLPGLAGLVEINPFLRTFNPGLPFAARPDSISGWFTYVSGGCRVFEDVEVCPDACRVIVELTRWEGGQRELVGLADWNNTDTVLTYARFSAPINYVSDATPDSIMVILSSSVSISDTSFNAVRGSLASFDALELIYTMTNTTDVTSSDFSLEVFPNPASHQITISRSDQQVRTYTLFYLQGQIALQARLHGEGQIDTSHLPSGTYLLSDGQTLKRVVIARN